MLINVDKIKFATADRVVGGCRGYQNRGKYFYEYESLTKSILFGSIRVFVGRGANSLRAKAPFFATTWRWI